MASALIQEENGARNDSNGSTTSILLEIDMSCNSCVKDHWQIFDGTDIELEDDNINNKDSDNTDSNCFACNGTEMKDFISTLQSNVVGDNKNSNSVGAAPIVKATKIPFLYPNEYQCPRSNNIWLPECLSWYK